MSQNNFYADYSWDKMLSLNPQSEYSIQKYHQILSPDWPDFLQKYLELPLLKRLEGVGLLCGTDWTKLYKNRFYYSRLDHSVGVALIIWHFTQDKAQTIAGLLHDVSTPVFSHVSDFRKGDALTQTATESDNARLLRSNEALLSLLKKDGLSIDQVEDYHKYPVADNEIPQLSADRLEYMYPSGMALDGSWTLETIKRTYEDIRVFKNENGEAELGFCTLKIAEEYCRHFCLIGHILQLNENKLTLNLLGQIMNRAIKSGCLTEEDFMTKNECQIIEKLEQSELDPEVNRLFWTFRTMTKIEHTDQALPENDYYSCSLKVKQRYINPLVHTKDGNTQRLSTLSSYGKMLIDDFLAYEDSPYGCVKLVK